MDVVQSSRREWARAPRNSTSIGDGAGADPRGRGVNGRMRAEPASDGTDVVVLLTVSSERDRVRPQKSRNG
jgi:hypothetical protein